jgi:hypothetical protein
MQTARDKTQIMVPKAYSLEVFTCPRNYKYINILLGVIFYGILFIGYPLVSFDKLHRVLPVGKCEVYSLALSAFVRFFAEP